MLFEILPASMYQLARSRFTELPAELVAGILRYLDRESLLNVVEAHKLCKNISLEDPVLRRRLKRLLKEKKKLEMDKRISPALGVMVTKKRTGKMFGVNLEKNVAVLTPTNRECFADIRTDYLEIRKRRDKDDITGLPVNKRYNYRL